MVVTALVLAQVLCSFEVEGTDPVRFGIPVEVAALERGMRLDGDRGAVMQWSLLTPDAPALGDRVWIEVVLAGQAGRARLRLGGDGPVDPSQGSVCRTVRSLDEGDDARVARTIWTYDGVVDTRTRTWSGEARDARDAGETLHADSPAVLTRRTRVRIPAQFWRDAGVLPRADGTGREFREGLLAAVPRLPRAGGARGRGDYVRGPDGEVVTNGEFDTTLGFARLGLVCEDDALLERAWESAWHLVDVDLERRSGLPYRHGRDHRSNAPETGHVWVSGLFLVAAVFADRDLLAEALTIASALAARTRMRERLQGPADRMRDEAWPLLEIESALRVVDSRPLRNASDALVRDVLARWDPQLGVFRYGEGETRRGVVYKERIWLTAGILLPALQAAADRGGPAELRVRITAVEALFARVLLVGRGGIALQTMLGTEGPFDAAYVSEAPEAFLLLDGLAEGLRRRVLGRTRLRRALDGVLDPASDDLATRFSIMARCTWILR